MFIARPYQIEDLATLMKNPRHLEGQDPGCGKTYIAAMFTQYILDSTNERVVWTMPGGIMAKNQRDILFSTKLQPEQVVIVQGGPAKRQEIYNNPAVKVFLMTGVTYSNEWALLPSDVRHSFHDEIHLYYTTYDSRKTKQTRTGEWFRACKNKGAIVPMTGTFIRGRLDSAYPICHVLAPWAYGNDRTFLNHHAVFDENGGVIGWKNHERLRQVSERFGTFRSFKSVYGEEKKVFECHRFKLSKAVQKAYDKLKATGLLELTDEFVDSQNPAVNAMRCRQLMAAPELFELAEETEKDANIRVDVENHLKTGERLAIFSPITAEQLRVVRIIKSLGGIVGHINGTVSNVERQRIDQEFCAGNLQFVVASPQTAGIGFSWNFLNLIIYPSIEYTDDSLVQSYRRGIRGTRETPLRVKLLKYEDTIEDRIWQIVDRKNRDYQQINPGIELLNISML